MAVNKYPCILVHKQETMDRQTILVRFLCLLIINLYLIHLKLPPFMQAPNIVSHVFSYLVSYWKGGFRLNWNHLFLFLELSATCSLIMRVEYAFYLVVINEILLRMLNYCYMYVKDAWAWAANSAKPRVRPHIFVHLLQWYSTINC